MSSADDRNSESAAPFPTCSNCRYWDTYEDGDESGVCRRYPPRIPHPSMANLDEDGNCGWEEYPIWPLTMDEEWCGEHKLKEKNGLTHENIN